MSFGPTSGYYNRPSRGCLFQISPVTGCDFLAYSCAAARDLLPLPISQRVAGLRSCANPILRKSKNSSPVNLPGTPLQSQTLVERRSSSVSGWSTQNPEPPRTRSITKVSHRRFLRVPSCPWWLYISHIDLLSIPIP